MMKLNDVANQLRLLLPQYTTRFSDYLSPTSITSNGSVVTFSFALAHGMSTGQFLVFSGVARRTPLLSFVKTGSFDFTFETTIDHDLTMNWYRNPNDRSTLNQVSLNGFTVTGWNTIHTLNSVANRRHFLVQSALANPVLNGNEYILEIDAGGLYGAHQITVVNPTTLSITASVSSGIYQGGNISKMPRVSVAVTEKDAWDRIITPLATDKFALIVLPIDAVISKDRSTFNDGVSSQTNGTNFRLKLLDGFVLLIIAPTHAQLSGATALDICKHDLRSAIYKSILGISLPTGLTESGDYKVVPLSDGVAMYDVSKLIYQYIFQYPMDLTSNDIVPPAQTSAFRTINYTLDVGDGVTTESLNLDDEPLD